MACEVCGKKVPATLCFACEEAAFSRFIPPIEAFEDTREPEVREAEGFMSAEMRDLDEM